MARVLVIDDQKGIRILLREYLKKEGHDVLMAENVFKAREVLHDNPVDVVALDIVMPEVSGVELLQEIREEWPDIQVILITGQPDLSTTIEALRLGAFDYLQKPISKVDFLNCVLNAARTKSLLEEKKSLEKKNLQYQQSLEKLVAERTIALEKSKERFEGLFKNALAGLFRTRISDGLLLEANPVASKILGFENLEECLNKGRIFDHYADGGQRLVFMERLREKGRIEGFEVEIKMKGGSSAWVNLSAQIYPEEDFIEGVVIDITEQKRMENRLRETEEKFSALYDRSFEMVYLHDFNGNFLEANQPALNLLGYSEQDVPKLSFGEMLNEEDMEKAFHHLQSILKDGHMKELQEYSLTTRSGKRIIVETKGFLVYRKGEPWAIMAVARDITQRKRDQEKIIKAQKDWENIFHAIGHPTFILSPDFQIVDANRAIQMVSGLEKEEIIGKKCFEIFHESKKPPHECPAKKMLLTGCMESQTMEVESLGLGGTFLVNCTPVLGQDGSIEKIIHIATDITETKKAEAALMESEKRLQQAQKMEAIGTLAGGIAHDFNNILAAIIGFTELAIDEAPPKSMQMANLKSSVKASYRAQGLVRQILTFARRENQEKVPLQVESIVSETVRFLRATIPATIDIRFSSEKALGPILADPTHIHQVLMNLATNAEHAMRKTGGVLEIKLTKTELAGDSPFLFHGMKPGKYLLMKVSDTGCGIQDEIRSRIFEPYFTTKDMTEGTGLGLSVVLGTVQNHGGSVTVESEPGQGTAFFIYFPMLEDQVKQKAQEEKVVTGRGHILFVDDEKAITVMAQRILENMGYQVTTANGGAEALDLLGEDPDSFDLVVTDMTMPIMTGDILADRIKSLRPDLPVILCTGFSSQIDPQSAEKKGIEGFLMKPFSKVQLSTTLANVLKGKG